MKKKSNKVVLITPTYNEAENIEKTIKVVFNSFPKMDEYKFHILVIDGNSPDGTASKVRSLIPQYENLHLIVEKGKKGLGAAYIQAMKYAFNEMNSDYVFTFDADLSHDPSKIREFIERIEDGCDFVTGSRYKKGGSIPKEWGFHRKVISRGGNLFTRLMFTSKKITDWTSGYNLLSKEVFEKVKDKVSLERGYNFMISLKKNVLDNGFKVGEVPYDFTDREFGESKIGPEYLFRALYYVVSNRIRAFISSYFFKIALVGAFGALVQMVSFYALYSMYDIKHLISLLISIELAIISNFILNNNFSFKKQKITSRQNIIPKFLQFNLLSGGSVVAQFVVNAGGVILLGESDLVVYSLVVLGILVGLIANYYFYTRIIWKIVKK